MTAENNSEKWSLDPSIFDGGDIKGERENLFGTVGEITKSGQFYSLNRGFNWVRREYALVVLDVNNSNLHYCCFQNHEPWDKSREYWEQKSYLIDPWRALINEDYFYAVVGDFFSHMEELFPKMEEAESKEVKKALKKSAKHLLSYFENQRDRASLWVGLLSSYK